MRGEVGRRGRRRDERGGGEGGVRGEVEKDERGGGEGWVRGEVEKEG